MPTEWQSQSLKISRLKPRRGKDKDRRGREGGRNIVMGLSSGFVSLHPTPLVGVLGSELNMRPDGRMKVWNTTCHCRTTDLARLS